jgi:hypothetical protein
MGQGTPQHRFQRWERARPNLSSVYRRPKLAPDRAAGSFRMPLAGIAPVASRMPSGSGINLYESPP